MKTGRRILSLVLAVVMLLGCMCIQAAAADSEATFSISKIQKFDKAADTVGEDEITAAAAGDIIVVTFAITNNTEANFKVAAYTTYLKYNANFVAPFKNDETNENGDELQFSNYGKALNSGWNCEVGTSTSGLTTLVGAKATGTQVNAGRTKDFAQVAFEVLNGVEAGTAVFELVTGTDEICTDEEENTKTVSRATPVSLAINGTTPVLASVSLSAKTGTTLDEGNTIHVNGTGEDQLLQASALSAKGNDITSSMNWTLAKPADVTSYKGVTFDATGKVTIANNATAGTYTITATPKNGEVTGEAKTATFTVVREEETAASITISGGVETLYLPGNVALRTGEFTTTASGTLVQYWESEAFTATVTNQYGETTSHIPVEWTFVPTAEGETLDLRTQYRHKNDHDYCTDASCEHADCEKYTYNNATGLEISASGHLMLTSACTDALGTATIQAKAGDKTANTTVTVTKAEPQTATVTFTAAPTSAVVPADGADDATYNYAVAVKDQYGAAVSGATVAWSITPEVTGVSISQSGVLTVTNAAKAEILSNASFDDTLTITATCGGKLATTEVTVARAAAQPTSIAIYKNGTKLNGTTDTVTIPTGDTDNTYTYTAKVLDQYGAEMMGKTATLTPIVFSDAGGVSFADGVLTVTNTAVKDKTVLLTATCTGLVDSASVTITLKDIDITPPTVTIKENPTYGDSWSDIVSFTGGSASLNGTNVVGEFYLKTTGKPNAGDQSYEIYFKSNNNQYDVLAKSGSVTVAKKALTITANDNTITYGEAPRNNGVTYSGFIDGEDQGVLSGTLYYEHDYVQSRKDPVGSSYTITPKGLSSDNYAITFVPGTLTVRAKPLAESMVGDITAVTYTGAAQRPAVTVTDGTALTKNIDYTVSYSNNTNAGTATATISGKGNYSGEVTKDFTINKAELTIESATFAEKTYDGGKAATVTGVTFSGLRNSETLALGADYTATGTFASADAAESVNASVTVTLKDNSAKAKNYTLTEATKANAGSAKIKPTETTLTITAANATYTGIAYATSNITKTSNVTTAPVYTYYADNNGEQGDALAAAPVNVGAYWVSGHIDASGNNSAVTSDAVRFQITKAPLTVTATDKTIIYGAAPDNAGVSYSGFVNGEIPETSDLTGSIAYTYSYQQYGSVGSSYTITPKGLTSNNYAITFAPGKLTVEQREVGISWGDASFTYNGSAQAPAATATGAVNDDSVTVTVSGAQSNAGTGYTATATGLSNGNYKLPASGLTKSFSIDKATLTNVSAAQSGTLTYNGRAQCATVRWSATTVGSNTTTIAYSTASDGTYGAQVPGFTDAGNGYTVYYRISAPNHNDATGSFPVTIGKRPLTVAPKSFTITVGETIPAFALEWNGVAEDDTLALLAEPSFECLKADGTAADSASMTAGTYTIRWLNADEATLTGDNAENYEFTKLSTGTLTIEERHSTYNGRPVSLIRPKNGSVSISPAEAKEGATVTITATPDSGYELESLTATDAEGRRVALKRVGEGKYTFTMPDSAVTIRASFGEHMETPFVDVPEDKYFYDAVMWAVENGITGGVDATHFAPYASCTRGHLVTFLWRAAGEPAATSSKGFSDVAAKRSCAEAVLWAAENGIVGGYDNGTFRPDAAVTRQQAAAILWRFAKYAGMDVSVGEDTNILSYNDAFDVSEYATSAIQWAVGEGIMQGNRGYLLPGDTCTRAQIVTFLFRACAEQ